MVAKVDIVNGLPAITINGAPIPEMAYITYRPEFNKYEDFAAVGTKLFSVNLNFSEMPVNERAPVLVFQKGIFENDEPDFSIVDRNFDQIFDACPDAYIFPRVNINLSRKWEESHPTELCQYGFNEKKRFSYASDKWAQDAKKYLSDLVNYIENSKYHDRVIGYQIAAGNTEEWLAIDPGSGYGVRAAEKFDLYCKENHTDKNEQSYYKFMSEVVASRIIQMAEAVKELTGHNKLVGCFYGYTLFVDRSDCHNALEKGRSCKDVDFICPPISYADVRKPGIDLYAMVPTASLRHHKKVYFSENDVRTHLSTSIHEHPNYTSPIWYGPEKSLSAEQMKLTFCRAMLYGYGMWWFDMWGGWYADDEYMDIIGRMGELCKNGMDKPDAEIGVYVDENSVICRKDANVYIKEAMHSLGLCGSPYDVYLMSDFSETFDKYRACVLVEPTETSLSRSAAEKASAASKPTLKIGDNVPNPEEMYEWVRNAGIVQPVDRTAVVYRGEKYISLYTPQAGVYDFCDGGKRSFVELFDGHTISFPTTLPKGKLLMFERTKI